MNGSTSIFTGYFLFIFENQNEQIYWNWAGNQIQIPTQELWSKIMPSCLILIMVETAACFRCMAAYLIHETDQVPGAEQDLVPSPDDFAVLNQNCYAENKIK